MRHVINKLTFEMACTDEKQAFEIRENFIEDLYDEMITVIETCCNRVSDDQQLLQIDKLEINLQAFKDNFLGKQQYIKLFESAFEGELKKKASVAIRKATQQQPVGQSHLDIILYFLETGALPWWTDEKEVDIDRWCSEVMNGKDSANLISRIYMYKNKGQIWKRIVYQLPPDFKAFIISKIPLLLSIQDKLSVLYKDLIDQQKIIQFRTVHRDEVINDFILKNGHEIIKQQNPSIERLFVRFLLSVLPKNEIEDLPEPYKSLLIDVADKEKIAIQEISDDYVDEKKVEKHAEEKMMVGNAGIILLTAFLMKFYTNLGLWVDGEWVSESEQYKAVYLLHYLATGEELAFEYQLMLEKVICGVPLSESLDRNIKLTENEKEEADDLLKSVIQHWAALKNTSITGLRHSFLQREGLLSRKGDGWLLQIERKTMDILLEQLPWGYATVIFPWNKYLIFTEW